MGGKLISLSEQDLVDCSTQNSGCNGGLMDYGFAFVESNQGLCTETDYPYLAYQEWRCREDGCQKYDSISSYQDVSASRSECLPTVRKWGVDRILWYRPRSWC